MSNINHIMFSSTVFPFKTLINKNNNVKKNRLVVTVRLTLNNFIICQVFLMFKEIIEI